MRRDQATLARAGWVIVIAAALAFPWLADAAGHDYFIGVLRRALIFAIAAASLNFILGFGGMPSLGHAAFFGIGAYTVGIAMAEGFRSAWIAWPLAVAIAAAAAAAIGAVSLRTRGVHLIMITLAFAQMIYYLAVGLKHYGGEDGLSLAARSTVGLGIDLADDITFYYVVLGLLAAVVLGFNRVLDARFGRVLVGLRENPLRMEALGFPTFRLKLAAFAIAGGVAGLAGALIANHNAFVSPALLHWTQSATLVVMVIVGGIGYRLGGVIGAVALVLLEDWLAAVTEFWHLPLGLLLIAVAFFVPRGIASLAARQAR